MTDSDRYKQLLQWLRRYDGFAATRGCQLQPTEFPETGRGLKALRSFKPGDVMVAIPEQVLITSKLVLGSSYLGSIIKGFPPGTFSALDVLCIFLMSERHKGAFSCWHPYITVLPETYTNAAHWTESEISLLPQHVRRLAQRQHKSVRAAHIQLQSVFQKLAETHPELAGAFTLESYMWAWSSVNTRCVYMNQPTEDCLRKSEADKYVLAPFLDLLNHSPTAQVDAGFNEETRHYEIHTKTSYTEGEQVFICYGSHSNAYLLVEYGFTLPDNPNNTLPFDTDDLRCLGEMLELPCLDEKMNIILDSELHEGLFCSMEGLSWNLESALGLLTLKQHQLLQWRDFVMGDLIDPDQHVQQRVLAMHLLSKKKTEIQVPHLDECSTEAEKMAAQICNDILHILDVCLGGAR